MKDGVIGATSRLFRVKLVCGLACGALGGTKCEVPVVEAVESSQRI